MPKTGDDDDDDDTALLNGHSGNGSSSASTSSQKWPWILLGVVLGVFAMMVGVAFYS